MVLFGIGIGAVAVLVVGWLFVSVALPSPKRTLVEWISATALYVALVSLFVNWSLGAWESDNKLALVAFGFLALLFGSGGLVSLYNACTALKSGGEVQPGSATH